MTDTEELLSRAFAAKVAAEVAHREPPPLQPAGPPPANHRPRWGVLVAAAAVVALATALFAIGLYPRSHATSPAARPAAGTVHFSFVQRDGATYGVGQPIAVAFSGRLTDAHAFVKAARVTVNGAAAGGAWYFLRMPDGTLQAHYRPPHYWPAHATIRVQLPLDGVAAGSGAAFAGTGTLTVHTGAAHVSTVDGSTHRMTVTADGAVIRTIPVSLGITDFETASGIKVVVDKKASVRLTKPSLYDVVVHDAVQLSRLPGATNSGEYVYGSAANMFAQGSSNVSAGCTDISPTNARWFYRFSRPGDVVAYVRTGGAQLAVNDGYGDWNVPWSTWLRGGALPTGK